MLKNFQKQCKRAAAIFMTMMMVLGITACGSTSNDSTADDVELETDVTVNLWYTDDKMTTYFDEASTRYHAENNHVTVVPKLVPEEEYLEAVYNSCVKENQTVDLFMMSSDNTQKAYLMGLMATNDKYASTYTAEEFGQAAITASSYAGRLLGYPLTFDTAVMVYNKKYAAAVDTFEQLKSVSDNFQHTDENAEVDIVAEWDVSTLFPNYAMTGAYMSVGGNNADDKNTIALNDDGMKQALGVFAGFADDFGFVRNTITYSSCLERFTTGQLLYTILRASDLSALNASGIDYGISRIPDYNAGLKTKAMSVTNMLVVTPYASNSAVAKGVAKAFTYDYADNLYAQTGYASVRGGLNNNPTAEYTNLHSIYADSVVKARFIEIGDYYLRMEIMYHQIWDGADIETSYNTFKEYVQTLK